MILPRRPRIVATRIRRVPRAGQRERQDEAEDSVRQVALALAVVLLGVLAACGGSASADCGTSLRITVKGSTVTPPPGTTDVQAGCRVDLTVTADRTSEVHVHVVDLEKPITAGQPLQISFTPSQQGVYEVELHDPDLLLVKLAVR